MEWRVIVMKKWIPLSLVAVSFFWLTGFSNPSASIDDMAQKYPTYVKQSDPSNKRQVALTFDDGPDTVYTPRILDVLKENHAKATFFLIGNHAEANPEIVKRIVSEGNEIGNHTYDHRYLPDLPTAQFQNEILDTGKILNRITGHDPLLFRPPYTSITEEQVKWLADHKIYTIAWNDDTQDWKGIPTDLIEAKVFDQIKPGSIIVMHSASPDDGAKLSGTVEALPRIIKRLREQGLEPVTVSQLLGIPAYTDGNSNNGPKSSESEAVLTTSQPGMSSKVTDNVYGNVYGMPEPPKPVLRLDSEDYSLVVGEPLDTVVTSVSGNQKVDVTKNSTFSISDPTIASVDRMGTITGLKRGETVLTATYNNMKTTAKIYVY
jgi:peptidoglycan/xylan/chitin deacetylase (PgdA/CDA1 family)